MRLLKRRVLHARGHEKREAREDAHEHDDHEEAVAPVPGRQLDRALEEQAERDAQEDEAHSSGDLERHHALVLLVAADVSGRAGGDGGGRRRRGAAGEVTRHELVERAVEDLAHLEELVHLRLALLGLPFCDALAGDAEQHGQLLLGHVALCAQVLEVVAKAHGLPFFGVCSVCRHP